MNERKTVHGPYDTRAQARTGAAPLIAAERAADPGSRPMTDAIRAARLQARIDYLEGALDAAGVQLGAFDKRIAAWLADWETETLQVLVGWIERARADQAHDAAAVGVDLAEAAQDFDDPSLLDLAAAQPEQEAARLAADVVLFGERDGALHVLLIKRGWEPFAGCWALPGGWVDHGESAEAAAYRELTEEACVRIGPCLKPSGVYSDPGRDPRGRYVTFAYTASLAHCPPAAASSGELAAEWVPVAELPRLALAFDHAAIIRDALDQIATGGVLSAADLAALPWRVYGLPRPGDKGRPWLVNAFTTKQRAQQFAEQHPEHRPLTVTCADDTAAEIEAVAQQEITHHAVMRRGVGGTECTTRRFWEPMTRAWKGVTCPDCLAALDQAAPGGGA